MCLTNVNSKPKELRMNDKEAAYSVMAKAYAKASGNGTCPTSARQIMYAARGDIPGMTGKKSLGYAYFTQTLLPEYIRDKPDETADWDVKISELNRDD